MGKLSNLNDDACVHSSRAKYPRFYLRHSNVDVDPILKIFDYKRSALRTATLKLISFPVTKSLLIG